MRKRGYVIAAAITMGLMVTACGNSDTQTSGQSSAQTTAVEESSKYIYDYNGPQ